VSTWLSTQKKADKLRLLVLQDTKRSDSLRRPRTLALGFVVSFTASRDELQDLGTNFMQCVLALFSTIR
jgi:hypothetical protein